MYIDFVKIPYRTLQWIHININIDKNIYGNRRMLVKHLILKIFKIIKLTLVILTFLNEL